MENYSLRYTCTCIYVLVYLADIGVKDIIWREIGQLSLFTIICLCTISDCYDMHHERIVHVGIFVFCVCPPINSTILVIENESALILLLILLSSSHSSSSYKILVTEFPE